ncbi:Uncharacterised protein [Vibrio cholerae]|nr:Uncharacterised protein [Vibrio cholerae]
MAFSLSKSALLSWIRPSISLVSLLCFSRATSRSWRYSMYERANALYGPCISSFSTKV